MVSHRCQNLASNGSVASTLDHLVLGTADLNRGQAWLERFLGVLIEHYGGAFPTWLAPTPAIVLPIADRVHPYAHEVVRALRDHGVRAELDARNEKVGLKIREAQLAKIPYMLVVGDREASAGTVSVRRRDGQEIPAQPIDAVAAQIRNEILNREPGPAPSAAATDKGRA